MSFSSFIPKQADIDAKKIPMAVEERKAHLEKTFNRLMKIKSTTSGEVYYTSGNALSLYELFIQCCSTFSKANDLHIVYAQIQTTLPHLQKQSWLSGVSEQDKEKFIGIIASCNLNLRPLPLATATSSDEISKKSLLNNNIKIEYWISGGSIKIGDLNSVSLTIKAPNQSEYYKKNGWYIGSIKLGYLSSQECFFLVNPKEEFESTFIRGSIEICKKAQPQEILNSIHKDVQERLSNLPHDADRKAVIDNKKLLDNITNSNNQDMFTKFLQVENTQTTPSAIVGANAQFNFR